MATKPPTGSTIGELVDEIGRLDAELAPFKPKETRLEILRKQLRTLYDKKPATESFTAHGDEYAIEIGARGFQTVCNIPKLFKSVKLAVFLRICSVTQKAIAEHAPDVAASVLTPGKQTGHRTLTITQKGKP